LSESRSKGQQKENLSNKSAKMSKHANSPFKKLPHEALQNIKGFYSDKYAPHPTAELIKQLKFIYNPRYIPEAPPLYLNVSGKTNIFLENSC